MQVKKTLKILVLGDPQVGKTSLIERFVNNNFNPRATTPSIGYNFLCKDLNLTLSNNQQVHVKLQIWDYGQQNQHQTNLDITYFRGTDGCLFVYDLTEPKTLQSLDLWCNQFLEKASPQMPSKYPFIVAGNMCDRQDRTAVSRQRAENFVLIRRGNIKHAQVSAKTGENVDYVFEQLATMACEQQQQSIIASGNDYFVYVEDQQLIQKAQIKRRCCD